MMIRICTVLSSGLLFFFAWSGHAWPLAWVAPLPVLWYAFGSNRWVDAAGVAFTAYALGGLYLCALYRGALPIGVLLIGVVATAMLFTVVVLGSRLVSLRASGLEAVLAFPLLMVASELLVTRFSANGSFGSLAYSQVSFLPVIQIARITGLPGVTFVVALVPSSVAIALRRPAQRTRVTVVALISVMVVLAFGFYELHRPAASRQVKVGLTASDEFPAAFRTKDEKLVQAVIRAYVERVRVLSLQGAEIVLLPEEVVALRPEWREQLATQLAGAAHENHTMIVAGFRQWDGTTVRNAAHVYYPSGAPQQVYFKQHLVPGLEDEISSGNAMLVLPSGTGVAICKDMDFPGLGLNYSRTGAGLMLVPAWDFVRDGWLHASMAIMRGVEGGYSVARSAREGLLTATDERGRLLAVPVSSQTAGAMVVVNVPIGSGVTVYSKIGDTFGWFCVAGALWFVMKAIVVRGKALRAKA